MVSLGTLLSGPGGRKGFYWASAHAPSPSLLGSAGSRERQRDPPLPTYLDVGLLCPWVRSEGESESSVAAGPSAIHLGRGPQRSNSLSLHSHGISEETGRPAGCWRHLVASFFNYISEYLSRSPVVKGTGCIRVNYTVRLGGPVHLVLKPSVPTHCPRLLLTHPPSIHR